MAPTPTTMASYTPGRPCVVIPGPPLPPRRRNVPHRMIGRLARGLRSHGERRKSRRPYVHHKEAPVTIRSVLTRLAATGAITATMAVAAPVAAQDATPAEDAVGGGCTAEPRAIDELVGLYF